VSALGEQQVLSALVLAGYKNEQTSSGTCKRVKGLVPPSLAWVLWRSKNSTYGLRSTQARACMGAEPLPARSAPQTPRGGRYGAKGGRFYLVEGPNK
jgi:hypothetical protein